MSETVLRVENLGKKYRLGQTVGYNTLRETIGNLASAAFRRSGAKVADDISQSGIIWAIKNISFEAKQGETIGIVGKNGSGKSTLLKILSRITSPTEGRAEIIGRVGSLLEVGTGFNPELTGKENIYLNGAIIGMKRTEINRKFDEIVEFSGVERFIDTPVKRYSSGMYVRLAFAVAAHLDSEVLLVDEVLAVGDAGFQKKCLGKMSEVASKGRTVLFVSHNMSAVKTLCPRAIFLDQGTVQMDADSPTVTQHYLGTDRKTPSQVVWPIDQRPGNHSFKVNSVALKTPDGSPSTSIKISEGGFFEIDFEAIEDKAQANFALILSDSEGVNLFTSINNKEPNYYGRPLSLGRYIISCQLPGNILGEGTFSATVIGSGAQFTDYFRLDGVLSFSAIDDGLIRGDYYGTYLGVLRPILTWNARRC